MNKLVDFGNAKVGKAVSWALIILSTIVFFIGVLVASISPSEPVVYNVTLSAPGIYRGIRMGDPLARHGFHLDVNDFETLISVDTDSSSARNNTPVTFSIDQSHPYSHIIGFDNPVVMPGGVAVLRLQRNDDNRFTIPRSPAGEPPILIPIQAATSCGRNADLYVRVTLNPNDVVVTARLQQLSPWSPGTWIDTESIYMRHFDVDAGLRDDPDNILYRIIMTVSVFGEELFNTEITANHWQYENFDFQEFGRHPIGIDLFGGPGNTIYIPRGISIEEYRLPILFDVWVEIDGTKFLTSSPFLLTIRGWTRF